MSNIPQTEYIISFVIYDNKIITNKLIAASLQGKVNFGDAFGVIIYFAMISISNRRKGNNYHLF